MGLYTNLDKKHQIGLDYRWWLRAAADLSLFMTNIYIIPNAQRTEKQQTCVFCFFLASRYCTPQLIMLNSNRVLFVIMMGNLFEIKKHLETRKYGLFSIQRVHSNGESLFQKGTKYCYIYIYIVRNMCRAEPTLTALRLVSDAQACCLSALSCCLL